MYKFKCPKCKMESRPYESKAELIEAKKKHKEYCPKLRELARDYEAYCETR